MAATKKKTLNVLYQSDDNYAMITGTSIVSLLHNNQHLDRINIHYCNYKISKRNTQRLKKLVADYKNARITFIDASRYHDTFQRLEVKPWHGVYVTWLKMLAFGDMPKQYDRVLFLNGHTIINGPLDGLIELDFDNKVMALGYDCLLNEHKRTIGLKPQDGYYNCGIMLVNLNVWRRDNIHDKVIGHLKKKSDYVIADQDLCNVMFKGKIKLLDVAYNFSSLYYDSKYSIDALLRTNNLHPPFFYSAEDIKESFYSPRIVHALSAITGRPWQTNSDHPNRFLWRKYIRMTPWKNEPLQVAKWTLPRVLHKTLPSRLFLFLYRVSVKRKFA